MRRKRLQHHTDIFCEMFYGWRSSSDLLVLTELGSGTLEFDFVNKSQSLNGLESKFDFNVFYEISKWFDDDLERNEIDPTQIEKATLNVEFDYKIIPGNEKSQSNKTADLSLILNAFISTNEKDYSTIKKVNLISSNIGR